MIVSGIVHKLTQSYSKGAAQVAEFTHLTSIHSPTRNLTLHQYAHNTTKARIFHFQSQDCEQAYASVIKTYVSNSKGSPHILQHLACCGSKKYPIRDPFFNMIKRSVNTYMNAWTGDDFTAYPFSSANPTDWRNLYQVYLDMSLRPLLNKLDFLQEGWRFEINEKGEKELKGIVLNQMKGAYQDSDRQLILAINEHLFKGTPYAYDSGGNPKEIAQLEYSQLKRMYEHYYHPSNMAFYYYGRGSIAEHLEYLSRQYLSSYSDQSRRYEGINLKPEEVQQKYVDIATYTSECNNISINYLLGQAHHISPLQAAALRITVYLLTEKANALLYKQFIESGIGQSLGFSGLNQAKLTTFAFTLKGIYPHYESRVFQESFRDVLRSIIQKGVDGERVKEYVHQFEVKVLTPVENNGIRILQEAIPMMNHNLSLEAYLNPTSFMNQAVQKLQDRTFVSELLGKFFLNNQQMVVVRQLLAEKQQPEQTIQQQTNIEVEQIKREQEQLKNRQQEVQDADLLPKIAIGDLVKPLRLQPLLVSEVAANNKHFSQFHVKIPQSINFYRVVFNFQQLEEAFLSKLMLWVHVLNSSISTSTLNYNQLASKLANVAAGFNVCTGLGPNSSLNVIFQFSCLKRNVNQAFDLLKQMIASPKFQKQHTLNVFKGFANEWTQSLVQSPMQECLNAAGSYLTEAGYINNSYQRIKDSLQMVKNSQVQSLYSVSLALHKCPKITLIEHSNQDPIQTPSLIASLLQGTAQKMPGLSWKASVGSSLSVTHNYSVNFCTQQYVGPKYLSVQHAHLNLVLQLLQHEYLHPRIREQGGAYGSGARIRTGNIIALSSYLDPNSQHTFDVFDTTVTQLLSKDQIADSKLEEARIMQLGQFDRPKTPQNQAVNQILKGFTNQEYDEFRNALQFASFKQAIDSARKYLLNSTRSRCVFGKDSPAGFTEEKLKHFLI